MKSLIQNERCSGWDSNQSSSDHKSYISLLGNCCGLCITLCRITFLRVVSTTTFPECVKFSRGHGSPVRCMRRLPIIDPSELRRKMDVMVHYTAGDGWMSPHAKLSSVQTAPGIVFIIKVTKHKTRTYTVYTWQGVMVWSYFINRSSCSSKEIKAGCPSLSSPCRSSVLCIYTAGWSAWFVRMTFLSITSYVHIPFWKVRGCMAVATRLPFCE